MSTDLAENLLIPAGKKIYYNLILKLNILNDIDQSKDFEANFSTKFTIKQSGKKLTSEDVVSLLGYKVSSKPINYNSTYKVKENYDEQILTYEVPNTDLEYNIKYAETCSYDKTTAKFTLNSPTVQKYSEAYSNLSGKYVG